MRRLVITNVLEHLELARTQVAGRRFADLGVEACLERLERVGEVQHAEVVAKVELA